RPYGGTPRMRAPRISGHWARRKRTARRRAARPRAWMHWASVARGSYPSRDGWAAASASARASVLDSLEEQCDGTVEDRARIPVRNLAAQKGLEALELLVALLADRELDAIAVRRRRLDDRTPQRREGREDPGGPFRGRS